MRIQLYAPVSIGARYMDINLNPSPVHLHILPDAYVFNNIILNDNSIRQSAWYKRYFGDEFNRLDLSEFSEAPIEHIKQTALFLGYPFNHNYGHWHLNLLGAFLLARHKKLISHDTLILTNNEGPFQSNLLDFHGVHNYPTLPLRKNILYHVDCLLFSDCIYEAGYDPLIADLYMERANTLKMGKSIKLFISRRNNPKRAIANEDELTAYLINKGYIISDFDSIPIKDQVILVNSADEIVAAHGASGGNLYYHDLEPFKFVEIFNSNLITNINSNILVSKNCSYSGVVNVDDGNGKYYVDIDLIDRALSEPSYIFKRKERAFSPDSHEELLERCLYPHYSKRKLSSFKVNRHAKYGEYEHAIDVILAIPPASRTDADKQAIDSYSKLIHEDNEHLLDRLVPMFEKTAIVETPIVLRRLAWLDAMFAPENAPLFFDFYYQLEDRYSRNTLLKRVEELLVETFTPTIREYVFFEQSEWNTLIGKLKHVDCIEDANNIDKVQTFILEGYAYDDVCRAHTGDVVLDCGAYTGNTALYFSKVTGGSGQVYSFEPMPESYVKCKENLLARKLAQVKLYNLAITDRTRELSFTSLAGPGSRQYSGPDAIKIQGISIDEFVQQEKLERVNFIKMDIEGSELKALEGTVETCHKFNPRLAICVYHKPEDLITIPKKVLQINPNYRLYLKHSSYNFCETVLFAEPSSSARLIKPHETEAHEAAAAYKILRSSHIARQKQLRKNLLELYAWQLQQSIQIPVSPEFDANKWSFVLWPLSDDKSLHYEFIFGENCVEISLHFQGQWASRNEVIEQVCSASSLQTPLRNNRGHLKGCAFVEHNTSDYARINDLMIYLISISLPILRKNRLLSDKVCMTWNM